MIGVATPKKAPASFRCLEKRAVTAWIRGPIGDAVLHNVNIDAGTKRFMEAFATSAVNYFFN
jgi:hypothetical protein